MSSRRIPRPAIIDVEASGFGPSSYPIEVGFALTDGTRFSSLILPDPDWTYWDESAEKVHHVTRQTLSRYGRPICEVAAILNDRLKGKSIYSDGWVVDKPWIEKLFFSARIRQMFQVSSLETILTERQMQIWHETKRCVLADFKLIRHRASSDAFIIQETYARTLAATNANDAPLAEARMSNGD
jgi:hypothetical protein